MSENIQSGSNTIILKVDVSDALKGIKALNRESKQLINTLKQLKEVQEGEENE